MTEHPPEGSPAPAAEEPQAAMAHSQRRVRLRLVLLPLVALVAILAVLTVALAGRSNKPPLLGNAVQQSPSGGYRGFRVSPVKPAPPLRLRNYLGQPVDLRRYRGRAVLVAFIYVHCPDACPLIVAHLHTAQQGLGARASKLQIVAVSVDPRGDTPKTVAAFLKAHDMTGRMQYLIGSVSQLGRVWKAWYVGSQRDANNPELVDHSAIVFGITASGKIPVVYDGNWTPADIVHDVPRLAAT